jgi:hypothetical protein
MEQETTQCDVRLFCPNEKHLRSCTIPLRANVSCCADDVRGSEQRRPRRPPPVNPDAPRLTKDDYFTVPDIKRLQRMRDDELKARTQLPAK